MDIPTMMQQIVEEWHSVVKAFIETELKPLTVMKNPEKFLGKKYEEWTPEDMQRVAPLYGPEPNALSELIARKALERREQLKAEEDLYAR